MDHQRRSYSHRRRLAHATSYVLTLDGVNDSINCGHDASLANLADEAFTIDGWIKYDAPAATTVQILDKGAHVSINEGWALWIDNFDRPRLSVICATTSTHAQALAEIRGNGWHHIAGFFNDAGDRRARIAVDGVWYVAADAAVGTINADGTRDLVIGRLSGLAAQYFRGSIAWLRLSDTARFSTGSNFAASLPPRCTPPTVDANTVELWAMNDGLGATVAAASVSSPANDGAITGAAWEACQ